MVIVCIMPEYVNDLGDCCRVTESNGETLYRKKLQTVIREVYSDRIIDYERSKKKVADMLNQKNLNPLYISKEEILIPIKIRKPMVLKDSTYGYVNAFEIKGVLDKEVILNNGRRILFYDTKRVIARRKKMANLLKERFSDICYSYQTKENINQEGFPFLMEYVLKEINSIKSILEKYLIPIGCF